MSTQTSRLDFNVSKGLLDCFAHLSVAKDNPEAHVLFQCSQHFHMRNRLFVSLPSWHFCHCKMLAGISRFHSLFCFFCKNERSFVALIGDNYNFNKSIITKLGISLLVGASRWFQVAVKNIMSEEEVTKDEFPAAQDEAADSSNLGTNETRRSLNQNYRTLQSKAQQIKF